MYLCLDAGTASDIDFRTIFLFSFNFFAKSLARETHKFVGLYSCGWFSFAIMAKVIIVFNFIGRRSRISTINNAHNYFMR